MNADLISLLACPQTGSKLSLSSPQLISECGTNHYPVINDIPWLLKNPLHSLVDWSVKLNHFNTIIDQEIQDLGNELKKAPSVVKERLQQLIEHKSQFRQSVTQLIAPILSAKVTGKPVYDALSDRAPSTQNLLSYEANLYRDWVWGNDENQQNLQLVEKCLAERIPKRLLVLAAGSCRLAYDLDQCLSPEITIATDINPLLLFAGKTLLSGHSLDMPEFPHHPKTGRDCSIAHQILPPQTLPTNLHLVFADAITPAFKPHQFDTLITPWFVDIQPLEFGQLVSAMNQYLPVGGCWINFGSLVFNQRKQSYRYGFEELSSILQANGFEMEFQKEQLLPYLRSPYNAGYRMETVWSWRAVKTNNVAYQSTHQNLPEWIIDVEKIIPLTREIKAFAFSHQIYAELAASVDGKSSISQIANRLAREKQMDKREALSMVKKFLMKIL